MANKLKDSNPYCSFSFKRYWLKISNKKSSLYAFKANAYCTFNSCTIVSELRITIEDINKNSNVIAVKVTYIGKPVHFDKKACHIKGESRELTSNLLSKYSPSYLRHQGLSLIPAEVFASGNRYGIGATKSVLQKISSEAKGV